MSNLIPLLLKKKRHFSNSIGQRSNGKGGIAVAVTPVTGAAHKLHHFLLNLDILQSQVAFNGSFARSVSPWLSTRVGEAEERPAITFYFGDVDRRWEFLFC